MTTGRLRGRPCACVRVLCVCGRVCVVCVCVVCVWCVCACVVCMLAGHPHVTHCTLGHMVQLGG